MDCISYYKEKENENNNVESPYQIEHMNIQTGGTGQDEFISRVFSEQTSFASLESVECVLSDINCIRI